MSEQVHETSEIDAPPAEVWAVLMDPGRLGEWVSAHRKLEQVPAVPLTTGDTFRQRLGIGPVGLLGRVGDPRGEGARAGPLARRRSRRLDGERHLPARGGRRGTHALRLRERLRPAGRDARQGRESRRQRDGRQARGAQVAEGALRAVRLRRLQTGGRGGRLGRRRIAPRCACRRALLPRLEQAGGGDRPEHRDPGEGRQCDVDPDERGRQLQRPLDPADETLQRPAAR